MTTGGQFHLVTGALGLEDNALRLEQQLVSDLEDVSPRIVWCLRCMVLE
jgi:hypothetical protein